MKKIILLTILIVTLFVGLVYADTTFSDIKTSDWFYPYIETMTEKNIIKGYTDNTFKPQNTVTYAEFIKMFMVTATEKDMGNSPSGHWALNYYNQGIELGVFTEYDIPKELFDSPIPRKTMALMVSNIFKEHKVADTDKIKSRISDIYKAYLYEFQIIKAYDLGILTGYPDGEFKPEGTLTRAESAAVISRVLDKSHLISIDKEKEVPPVKEDKPAGDNYWQNDPLHDEISNWFKEEKGLRAFGAPLYLKEGKIVITANDKEWTPDDTNFPKMHEYLYYTLKTYYQYALETDMNLFISCGYTTNTIYINLLEKSTTSGYVSMFSFSADPNYYEEIKNYVKPYVWYNSKYFVGEDSFIFSYEDFVEKDRILRPSLIDVNRKIFKKVFGDSTGNKIMDYHVQKYVEEFDKTTKDLIDLPNEKINIDGVNVFWYDDVGVLRGIYMDKPL